VQLKDVGLVIPVKNTVERVSKLLTDIGARFETFGVKPGELRVVELRTTDQFLVSPRDVIQDVLEDGERYIALDYDTWQAAEEKNCTDINNKWAEIVAEDYEDDTPKWIQVGLHPFNKIYVKIGTGWPNGKTKKLVRLEIFDVDALRYFSKDGQVLIASKEAEDKKWSVEAYFTVEKGTAKEIMISARSSSDRVATVKRIGIKFTGNKIVKGAENIGKVDGEVFDPSKYKVDPPVYEGPVLSSAVLNPTEPPKQDPKSTQIDGSALELTYTNIMEPDQTWGSGSFNNLFNFVIGTSNRTTNPISVVKVHVDYKNHEGAWVPCDEVYTGVRRRYWDYSWYNENKFKLEPKSQFDVAIRAVIAVKADTYTARRRAHKSLPQPLRFRATLEDIDGGKSTIEFDQYNVELNVATKEEKEKETNYKKNIFWIHCDDPELEGRSWAMAGITTDQKNFELKFDGKSYYISASTATKIAYKAVKEKKAEYPMEDLPKPHAKWGINVFYLVDLAKQITYGMKVELTTLTSKAVGSFILPNFATDLVK